MNGLENIPWWGVALLVVLAVAQLGLQVVALVALLQAPESRLQLIKNRWVWLAVILLTNAVGAIVFLAVGRSPATVDVVSPAPAGDPVQRAVAVLYGTDEPRAVAADSSPPGVRVATTTLAGSSPSTPRRAVETR